VKPKVYVETSVFSLIVARPSKNPAMAERQEQTRDWWQTDAEKFELYSSGTVRTEAACGDAEMAKRRLELIDSIKILPDSAVADTLATDLMQQRIMPAKAVTDALHISIATVHKMDFLVTWNCAHLANAIIWQKVMKRLKALGYDVPLIVTPEQLFGDDP
jgi:hypothetical protein